MFDIDFLFSVKPEIRRLETEVENKFGRTHAIYYKGQPYHGRDTYNFAYVGVPNGKTPDQGFPAVVLVHGGGGCAFHEWVEFWNNKGYVAIAPDISGQHNGDKKYDGKGAPKNPEGGPSGYAPFRSNLDNYRDCWIYHSVCNVIYCNNILREMDVVNPEKIAVTGISWGSVMTEIVSGVDNRFACFAPVYGGGYLHKTPAFLAQEPKPDNSRLWLNYFDPAAYLKRNRKPILFTSGVDDPAFLVENNFKSWKKSEKYASYSWRKNLEHYHRWKDQEGMINVYRFIDKNLGNNAMPFELVLDDFDGEKLTVKLDGKMSVGAKLNYAVGKKTCKANAKREWISVGVKQEKNGILSVTVPKQATYFFMEITDNSDPEFIMSSKMRIRSNKI